MKYSPHDIAIKKSNRYIQKWSKENLADIGIFECHYSYFNIEKGYWMTLPAIYDWYYEYIEKKFNMDIYMTVH